MTRGRPTLAQIAAELGVSTMTVSNAFNRPDQLSPQLRERVLAEAERLGYPGPDPLARGLRTGKTGAVGVLYDTWPSFVFADAAAVSFLEGLSRAIERAFMGLLLVPGPWPDRGKARPLDTALVDAFVVYSVAESDPQIADAIRRRPTVVVDQPRLEGVPWVGIDDRAAAMASARHLVALGHRRFGVITFALAHDGEAGFATAARQDTATYDVTRARLAGYRAALEEAGVDWPILPVFECPGSDPRLGRYAAGRLLDDHRDLTAVLVTSDALAIGALDGARDRGLAVPDELSIVGFDDAASAHRSVPPLTTVRQPHREKGRLAGRMIRTLIDGGTAAEATVVPAELVVRGSTASPRR